MDKVASIPLRRLNFLQTTTPPSVTPLISDLRQTHSTSPSAKKNDVINVDPKAVELLALANEVADLTDEHADLTRGIMAQVSDLSNAKDVARKFSHGQLAEMISENATVPTTADPINVTSSNGETSEPPKVQKIMPKPVIELQRRLFIRYPNAVLARMVDHGEIHVEEAKKEGTTSSTTAVANTKEKVVSIDKSNATPEPANFSVKTGLVNFLDANVDFNIREKSVVTALNEKGLQPNPDIVKALKVLQTTQALVHTPEAIPGLSKAGFTSAFQVNQLPEKAFVSRLKEQVGGEDNARAIHAHATNINARNNLALTSLLQASRGTGIAMIDGNTSKAERLNKAVIIAKQQPERVDLETLFGSLDICECDDCNSVTSPAAYFVELMQFLRNNNLDPNSSLMAPSTPSGTPHTKGQTGIQDGTPLSVLLSRRPDLADLQLTCANTNTVLPYIDLANEVMESFIMHLTQYSAEQPPKKAILDVYNADPTNTEGLGGSTAELLAQPEHTNYGAYCILANSVYPSTKLPFNQPVEAIRLFLEFLGTNRADLGERFRGQYSPATVTVPDTFGTNPADGSYTTGQDDGCNSDPKTELPDQGYTSDCTTSSSCSSSSDESCDSDQDESGSNPEGTGVSATGQSISAADQACLVQLHQQALDRANDAERLLLTEEEFIILTKEAFWAKRHFEIRHGEKISDDVYRQRIGIRNDWEYWGADYSNIAQMLDQDEAGLQTGLTFVKKQFLPRSGILYSQLVELLQTDFINPNMLKGKDKVIMQAFRLSYKYLKSLLGPGKGTERFLPLVQFIDSSFWHNTLKTYGAPDVMALFDEPENKDEHKHKCRHHHPHACTCKRRRRILKWLCQHFDCIGKIVVLESLLDTLHLPWEALLVQPKPVAPPPPQIMVTRDSNIGPGTTFGNGTGPVGTSTPPITGVANDEILVGKLLQDGTILHWDGTSDPGPQIGILGLDGSVKSIAPPPATDPAGTQHPWNSTYAKTSVKSLAGVVIGTITSDSLLKMTSEDNGDIPWIGLGDDCDISKDRLRHLDGGSVTTEEYDDIHRFIRLWRKLSWSMIEVDSALRVLGIPVPHIPICPTTPSTTDPSKPTPPTPNTGADDTDWNDFASSCKDGKCGKGTCGSCGKSGGKTSEDPNCKPRKPSKGGKKKPKPKPSTRPIISPDFLHQLVALTKLSTLTGLDILNLLTFWGTITTAGSTTTPSLYSQLFLTHNLLGIDQVFQVDANGNYLASSPATKISDHISILLAAFQIRLKDFNSLMNLQPPIVDGGLAADLTLDNVSKIYRHVLLSRILGVKPALVPTVFATIGLNAFNSAETALELVQLWNKMSDAGFGFSQINYVLTGNEANPLVPVGPSDRTILQATMSLYTGLNDISTQHPDIVTTADATSAAVLQNAQLIYAPDVATQIAGFLDGTIIFQTTAPSGLVITIASEQKTLISKLKYADGDKPTLQITGQLTADESQKAIALSADPGWAAAISRCAKRAATFLKNTLSGVFPVIEDSNSKSQLLKGDVAAPNPSDSSSTVTETAPAKRLYFLTWFLPYLRRRLADKLVTDTLSSSASLDSSICATLLANIIVVPSDPGTKISALDALEKIKDDPKPAAGGFTGYLIPPTTDTYILVGMADSQPHDIMLDGQAISLKVHSADDDPDNMWASEPIPLTGGRLYNIVLQGLTPDNLNWKTNRTQIVTVPPTSLLGNHVTGALKSLFGTLYKCAVVINGLSLTLDEVSYFQNHKDDFGGFDWNNFTLTFFTRLADYVKLRNALPKLDNTLINFFTWASGATADPKDLANQIYNVTLWETADINALVSASNFNILLPSSFRNEINLVKLQNALAVSTNIGMPIDSLFDWAKPRIDFWKLHSIAESIKMAIRAKYKLSDWEVAIKPTFDSLRQLQSDALTAYLINQPVLKIQSKQDVFDADELFEFLLIDTQMCPCMQTSRLKQATSSVQLFIQRCFLNLEIDNGITADMLDRGRWDWVQKYRLWEANRKVFLYPENWVQPSLRDDKSPIYLQLESELMQKDLDISTVVDVMKNFLYKLDEISNLEVDAIHIDDMDSNDDPPKPIPLKIHVFARTRGSPYKFYYRSYDISSTTWTPWQDMTIDIPRYEVEKDEKGSGVKHPQLMKPGGFYIVPFTFNSRLLVAFPQITKVQLPAPVPSQKMSEIGNDTNADSSKPAEYWDIKMGMSEFRHGKWSPKQITSESINEAANQTQIPVPLPPIGSYRFIARRRAINSPNVPAVLIDCYRLLAPAPGTANDPAVNPQADQTVKPVGRFTFSGSHFGVDKTGAINQPLPMKWSDFQFQVTSTTDFGGNSTSFRVMYPYQSDSEIWDLSQYSPETFVSYPTDETDRSSSITYAGYGGIDPVTQPRNEEFYHPFVGDLLQRIGATDNLDDLFAYFGPPIDGEPKWKAASHLDSPTASVKVSKDDAYGATPSPIPNAPVLYDELSRPYSIYNWELGFHAPMAIVDRLLQNQQFDLALKVMQYVFDPLSDSGGTSAKRAWKWEPFKETDASNTILAIFDSLRPNTADAPNGQINQWRDHPFSPHVIARLRPSAYMKYVAMKYINILIAYGDYYFNQNTLETIPMAIQCYVLASHIYGSPGQQIPKRGTKQVQTYNSLLDKWDAFSNAMVQMEVLFPFSINQITTQTGSVRGVVGLANIFGFATTTYFCVPDNPDLRALRSTIDDRLFKIRHCEDINGVFRILPLYEPPIDPGLLVAATAAGLSLSSILNDLNAPLPNFKFKMLLKKALDVCEQLRHLGKAFVRAKERQDHGALLELKQQHEGVITGMVLDQKNLSKQEAQKALDGLQQSRKAPEYRMTHNLKLLGGDLGQIPSIADAESEFKELTDQIESPLVDSGLKLIASEKDEIEKAVQSLDLKPIINVIETVASELHVLPVLNSHASPLGVGVAACWGPPNIAKGIQGAAKAYQMVSDWLSHQGSNVSRRQNFVKQNQSRVKEANTAGHEVKTVDKQILTQQVRLAVHDADISTQQKTTDNSQEIHDFLISKYTSTQLYIWTEQQVSSIYYQSYQAAFDLGKKAEMAFRYERGLSQASTPAPIIKFGYWEPRNDGMLCGEKLYMDLRALEAAYHESRGHDFEITKHVSLRAINPLALLTMRGDGITPEFAVPEILFDMDFPGHYARRLKSVAVTIRSNPDIPTDPYYAQVNCTLRMLSNKFRNAALVQSSSDYPEKTDQEDGRFTQVSHVPITSIATSSPMNDSGVFEIDFSDAERFLPFEGAGAISTWRLELNDSFRTFDYSAIQDVVLHLHYTALDGGQALGTAAKGAVANYIKSVAQLSDTDGLYAVFDIPHDFSSQFAAAKDGSARTFTLAALNTLLPVYTKGTAPAKLTTQDVYIMTDVALPPADITISSSGTVMTFSKANNAVGKSAAAMSALHWTDGPAVPLKDWVVTVGQGVAAVADMLILVRYSMLH